MTELLLLHNLTDKDMTTTDEIHVLIVHHTDLRIDRHIEKIHAHTYPPDITEPILLSNYNTPTKDIPSLSTHFSLHQIYITLLHYMINLIPIYTTFNPLLTHQNLVLFLHYHIRKTISNL